MWASGFFHCVDLGANQEDRLMQLHRFQYVGQSKPPDRTDHVWFEFGLGWKCCLCGAVARTPPPYPTPPKWVPEQFDLPLKEHERQFCPQAT